MFHVQQQLKSGTHPSQCRKTRHQNLFFNLQYIATKDTLAYITKGKEVFGAANFNAAPSRDRIHGCFCSNPIARGNALSNIGFQKNKHQSTFFVKKSWVKNPCHLTVLVCVHILPIGPSNIQSIDPQALNKPTTQVAVVYPNQKNNLHYMFSTTLEMTHFKV